VVFKNEKPAEFSAENILQNQGSREKKLNFAAEGGTRTRRHLQEILQQDFVVGMERLELSRVAPHAPQT
jgi:hypothetical protein